MNLETAATLVLVSRFLEYPEDSFFEEWSDLEKELTEILPSEELRTALLNCVKPLFSVPLKDLQELYVETFDYKEKTGLYLTAQELGDSRKRGGALIELQRLISDLGFERQGDELADYIPMLLELLAAAPEGDSVSLLKRRLAYSLHRILNHLPKENHYHAFFDLLMTHVFEAPKPEEIKLLENSWEAADLDPLPYPMTYINEQ
ncbi:nitrate reductase molybdenum cofactor assembly chaperone [Bacillus dakarensis]|uniref:nitrate reductase molybdenum cofactor assembly chaperone n=1 Tax=Robertmurraya dakarensis TaxID=1926278 RepID=UPI00098247AB|nr:nitrate reductase molybdenum cofactor assembly chaperone [Bacillus dakarensis]